MANFIFHCFLFFVGGLLVFALFAILYAEYLEKKHDRTNKL